MTDPKTSEYLENVRKEKLEKFKSEKCTFLEAKDIMSKIIYSVSANQTVQEAVDKLLEKKISAVIVTDDDGQPLGTFSSTDLALYKKSRDETSEASGFYSFAEVEDYLNYVKDNQHDLKKDEVRQWMSKKVIVVNPRDSLQSCCQALVNNHVHRVFVQEDKKLVGVISTTDIVRALA